MLIVLVKISEMFRASVTQFCEQQFRVKAGLFWNLRKKQISKKIHRSLCKTRTQTLYPSEIDLQTNKNNNNDPRKIKG